MKSKSVVPVVVLLVLGCIVIFGGLAGRRPAAAAESLMLYVEFFTTFGKLIAVLAASWMLVRAIGGASLAHLAPLSLPLIAGVVISNGHWSGVAALGTVASLIVVREIWSDASRTREVKNRGDGGRRRGGDRKGAAPSGGREPGNKSG